MKNRYTKFALMVSAGLLVAGACSFVLAGISEQDAEQNRILEAMFQEQRTRLARVNSFSRLQHYSVTTDRFGLKAEMVARVHRDHIKGKTFEVISRVGSPVIQSHVFDALLAAEVDTSHEGGELLTRENYHFHLIGKQEMAGRQCYVFETEPRHKDKRLLKGKLWVDAEDYGVVHVEGKPSESLSFWVGRPMIVQEFMKQSGFWWASRRHSYIDNLWLGKSDLVIEYTDYQFELRQAGDGPDAGSPVTQSKTAAAP